MRFKPFDARIINTAESCGIFRRGAHFSHQFIQVALNFHNQRRDLRSVHAGACQAERGGGFIQRAERFDAQIKFWDAAFAEQAGAAFVAGLSIEWGHARYYTRETGAALLLVIGNRKSRIV
ncbi:MAG: hypothetical protein NT121_10475 [Chloroflexi bacterium]|nr:hypothetical protein [Chloroflexota bacterium]